MLPNTFQYLRPGTLNEAVDALHRLGQGAKMVAGGHSLLPSMKLRLAAPHTLIDIGHLPELRGIRVQGPEMVIGACTTHATIEHDAELAELVPLLPRVASQIADPTVRNRGTLGGSLANGDPSADWPAAVLAAGATIDVIGRHGNRSIAADAFFTGLFETDLAPDELIVSVRFPVSRLARVAYRKFRHPASGYAVVGVAVQLETERAVCKGGRLAVTGLTDHARRLPAAEVLLPGYHLDSKSTEDILAAAFEGIQPLEDSFADGAYRLQLARTMLKRALADAVHPVVAA